MGQRASLEKIATKVFIMTYLGGATESHSAWTPPPSLGPIESVVFGLKNVLNFKGRASRSEFWWMYVGQIFAAIVLVASDWLSWLEVIGLLFFLAYQLALLSASVRRLHDVDFIGWWVVVPFVFPILLVKAGTPGPNRFG